MSEGILNLVVHDPFAESINNDSSSNELSHPPVHIRMQQRNGKKSITTIQGVDGWVDMAKFNKLSSILAKKFNCSCSISKVSPDGDRILQLQGDHRMGVHLFLIENSIVEKEHIKVHGF